MRLYLRAVSHTFLILRSTACLSSSPVLRFHTQSCLVNTTMPTALDVLIIGGGPGGLAVATGLARQHYTAFVFDSGFYRIARTKHIYNFFTCDHRDPADFRAAARSDNHTHNDTIRFE